MNILITGGCGFIGSHIADKLIPHHKVTIIDNLSTGTLEYLNPQAEFYPWDIRDAKLSKLFEHKKFDIVIHQAAQIDAAKSIRESHLDAEINVMGTINILENMKQFGVRKIIFPSSAAVYGNTEILPIEETAALAPISFYGLSKLTAEKYIIAYSQIFGFDYTILRYANVYGLRQGASGECGVVKIFWEKLLKGQNPIIFGDGFQTRDFIYVEDVVTANIAALTKGSKSILNISTKKAVPVNELFKIMKFMLGSSGDAVYTSARAGDIKNSYLCNARAAEALDWKPKYTLQEGIGDMYSCMKKRMFL